MDRDTWQTTENGIAKRLNQITLQKDKIYASIVHVHSNYKSFLIFLIRLPCSSDGKKSACSAGDQGSIPKSVRSSGEGNGNPLQYSCLENPMDRGVWQTTVHGIAKSQTRLSDLTTFLYLEMSNFLSHECTLDHLSLRLECHSVRYANIALLIS